MARPHRTAWARLLLVGLGAVAAVYAVQVFSPLRIDGDSTEYLVLAASVADGDGLPLQSDFPPGLPLLLGGLDAVGLAHPAAFVVLNLVLLAAGLAAAAWLCRRELGYSRLLTGVLLGVTLLSFNAVRFASHPLADVPFFGVSLGALALAVAARRRESLVLLAAATAATVVACSLRTVGVALLAALLVAVPPRRRRVALPALALLAALGLLVIGPRRYLDDLAREWRDDPLGRAAGHGRDLLSMIGENAVNAPVDRLPSLVGEAMPVVGALVLAVLVVGAVRLARRSPVIGAYLGATAAILLAWPYAADRFLLPVLPLLAACVVEAVRVVRRPAASRAVWVWAGAFAAVGVVALAATTRITFAGDRFPDRYGESFRATYRTAWGTATLAERRTAEPRMLWVLRRYEPRALGTAGPVAPGWDPGPDGPDLP